MRQLPVFSTIWPAILCITAIAGPAYGQSEEDEAPVPEPPEQPTESETPPLEPTPAETDGESVPASTDLPIRLRIHPCIHPEAERIRALLALEVQDYGGRLMDDDDDGEGTIVEVGCDGGAVEVRVRMDEHSLGRQVELTDQPEQGQARLLALLVSELVTAVWAESDLCAAAAEAPQAAEPPEAPQEDPGSPPEEAVTPPVVQPAPEPPTADRRGRLSLGAAGALQLGGHPKIWATGGLDVVLAHDLPVRWLGYSIDILATFGSVETSLGSVSSSLVSGGLGVWITLHSGRVTTRLGGGARLGFAAYRGEPNPNSTAAGSTATLPWAGPWAGIRLRLALPQRLFLDLGVEGGLVTWDAGAEVTDAETIWLGGGWFGATLALGVTLFE